MGCCSIELSLANLILLGALAFAVKKLIGLFQKWRMEQVMEKWDGGPKDKVILHSIGRCKPMPSISPYALKLETYLKLAKIPYELDSANPMGPKGKLPWMSYNGTHVADSHLCIQFLNKKFGINLDNGKSEEILALARACRIMLEEHFIWGIVQYRLVENSGKISELMKIPTAWKYTMFLIVWQVKKKMVTLGIDKHTPTEIYQMVEDDLRTVSKILGNKKFFGGEELCEDDCAIFGVVAQAVWGLPGSSFERLVNGELSNLKQYAERMKARAWPDWEDCIDKS